MTAPKTRIAGARDAYWEARGELTRWVLWFGKRVRWPGGEGVIVATDGDYAVVRESDGREERVEFGGLEWVEWAGETK